MVNRLPGPIEPLFIHGSDQTSLSKTVPAWVLDRCQETLRKIQASQEKKPYQAQPEGFKDLHTFPSWNDDLIKGDQMTGELGDRDHHLLERCIASDGYRSAYGYGCVRFVSSLTNWNDLTSFSHTQNENL